MDVSVEMLREGFAQKSTEDLRRIVQSTDGEYTPDAVAVAKEILAARPPEAAAHDDDEAAHDGKADTWSGVGASLGTAYALRTAVVTWLRSEGTSDSTYRAFHAVFSNPWTYVAIVLVGFWLWRKLRVA